MICTWLLILMKKKWSFFFNDIKECKNINIKRGISLLDDFKSVLKLKAYFTQHNFDAVHSVTPKAGLVSMLASKMAKIKIRIHIFTGQVWHTKHGLFKFVLKSIDKLIVYSATDILVDGESQRKFLIENKIVSEDKSLVLGKGSISGVDVNRFIPSRELFEKYRKELNIKNDIVFLFLGG